jgi:alpha-L-rhamnosidase
MAAVSPVRFEHRRDEPLGLGACSPRLSWTVMCDDPAWTQTAYELELVDVARVLVEAADQVLVPWPFRPLLSRERAAVRVRVASGERWSEWGSPRTVEAGLLAVADWQANFISPKRLGEVGAWAPVLCRRFDLSSEPTSARLYATAHGVYSAFLNGRRIGDDVLAPGWTSYRRRLRYQSYDATPFLQSGENILEVLLGDGWYRGQLMLPGVHAPYGERLALLAQLEATCSDGSLEVISSDEHWSARESHIVRNSLYHGTGTDLRSREGAIDEVEILDEDLGRLVAPEGPAIRVTDVVPARRVWSSPSGKTLVDFGQNLVGWVRLRIRGAHAGQEIVVRHAEVLEDGELCTRILRSAKATDSYVLPAAAAITLEPEFTFHGFRYAEVSGISELPSGDVEAIVIGSDLHRIGWFGCSYPDLERFHENVVWSARGNFVDVPMDCPQRDERMGWTADAQLFAPTASFLFDVAGFFSSWLADLSAEQQEDGTVPLYAPNPPMATEPSDLLSREDIAGAAVWSDAAVILPWCLYQRYGDVGILARQFDSMRRWVDKAESLTTRGLWVGGFQLGDWLDPDAPPESSASAKTDPELVATAYLARIAELLSRTADVLRRPAEADRYGALAASTRQAFAREYATPAGRLVSDTPTAYALALSWELFPRQEQRRAAAEHLADLVRANAFRISSGLVGASLIADALTLTGNARIAYRMMLERGCPSWLYPMSMGATTVWERWDSMQPDGSVNISWMTSFNHYAFGSVGDWLHRTVAGLAPAAPGYRHIAIRPVPDPALTEASATHVTPYGRARVSWQRSHGQLKLDIDIPAGTRATVYLPGEEGVVEVGHGQRSWTLADPCAIAPLQPSTIRDLIDTPALWAQALAISHDHGVAEDARSVARRCAPYFDAPVTDFARRAVGTGPRARQIYQALETWLAQAVTAPSASQRSPTSTRYGRP